MFSLHGIGVSGGIVIARARVLESGLEDVASYHVAGDAVETEVARLAAAVAAVKAELGAISDHLRGDAPPEARALLQVHAMLLDDPMLVEEACAEIRRERRNAEWALSTHASALADQFAAFEDPYLRERGRDVQQVVERVLAVLAGSAGLRVDGSEPAVFIGADVGPADMLSLRHALGFVLDQGGATSHSAILARGMGVPAVLGLTCASELIRDDDLVIVDGEAGVVVVDPDEALLAEYRARQAEGEIERAKLRRFAHVEARTLDGTRVELHANIERPEEADDALAAGAEGVGLFRSEFLFMGRRELPGEDEQYEAYRAVVHAMQGRPVTIRTLDVGADKTLGADHHAAVPNPALGRRAIRYSLAEPEMFLVQLRALLRASADGPVRLLIPMLAHAREVDQALRLIEQAREQLRDRRIACAEQVPVGGMIEVPAAALSVGLFARRLDFLSIGTNDLIQYTLAIDRADSEVASLYDPYHPAVLRLIAQTIRGARRAGKPVAVCGELAGDWSATRLLLGMGLTEFSMQPMSLLRVKKEVLLADAGRAARRVSKILATDDPRRVAASLAKLREE